MFELIKNLIGNAKKLNQTQIIVEAFTDKEVKDGITNYITRVQLFEKGEDGLGRKLEEYSPFTVIKKEREDEPFDRTTLKDQGRFYSSYEVTVNGREVLVRVNDLNGLTNRYGIEILKLSDEGVQEIQPKIIQIIQRYVLETLFS